MSINIDDLLEIENLPTVDAILKAKAVLGKHRKISVSISGGSDSDIVIDMIEKVKQPHNEVKYVWFDTGLEYQATKDHLKYLEEKYGVKIERRKAIKSIPTCVREYGVPFLSKYVSQMVSRLQKHDFKFEDKPYKELIKEYPKCMSAIKWWCNCQDGKTLRNVDKGGRFNISRNKWLKEFMIENPPTFRIDNKCCLYAKKKVAKNFLKEIEADLNVIGVRKSEGGIRSSAYKNCYSSGGYDVDQFRPIFWLSDGDKRFYEQEFDVKHSDCYTKYGLKRTGCVGCPYSMNILDDLVMTEKYEPKLYKACMKIFGQSYEYTKQYRQFCLDRNHEAKQRSNLR